MTMTAWRPPAPRLDGDLPEYLAEPSPADAPGPGLQDAWGAARHLARSLLDAPRQEAVVPTHLRPSAGAAASIRPTPAELSGRFFRSVAVPGIRLGAIVTEWWAAGVDAGVLAVDARLRLEAPRPDALGGWTAHGRMRRLTRLHWVPVVLELWPSHDRWTILIMTPRREVITSGRYFRVGNAALDRLTAQLAMTSAARTTGEGAVRARRD